MTALVDELLDLLRGHSLIKSVRVVNIDETPAGKLELKIRCKLVKNYRLQIWLHHEVVFQDYAYQLFTDRPLLRWDNSPHYPRISTSPHHFHNEHGEVSKSALSGKTLKDVKKVLAEIERWLSQEERS